MIPPIHHSRYWLNLNYVAIVKHDIDTYAISEGKMQNVTLNVKLRLQLKSNNLPPMHHLGFEIHRYIF